MLKRETLGDAVEYLMPNLSISVSYHDGKAVGIELPGVVEMTVMETEPGIKSATAILGDQAGEDWRPGLWCRCRRSSTKARRFASIRLKALT